MATVKGLLVGIDDYGDPRNNLDSCVADVAHVRTRLERDYGFPPENITTLIDAEATLANVRTALDALFTDVGPEDRLIFMYSGHGYQVAENDALTEVLVLRDGFFTDDELSQRTAGLPPAVLTVISDSCHSGGMQKFFVTAGGGEVTRAKVWLPTDDQAIALNTALSSGTVKKFAPFGAKMITTNPVAAAEKGLGSADVQDQDAKAFDDEEGQPRLNALLLTACREDETASARRSDTKGLSAFTYALGKSLDALGIDAAPMDLHREAERILTELGFQQRPLIFEPPAAPEMAETSFVLGKAKTPLMITSTHDLAAQIRAAIEQALTEQRKDKIMTTTTVSTNGQVDEKFLQLLPALIGPAVNIIGNLFKEYQPAVAAPAPKAAAVTVPDEKFLELLPDLIPPALSIIETLFKNYQPTVVEPASTGSGDAKFFPFPGLPSLPGLPGLPGGDLFGSVLGGLFKAYQSNGQPTAQKTATPAVPDEKWLQFLPIVLPPLVEGISSLLKDYQPKPVLAA
ncbi:caspase family protein [Microlunatus parietis]|uniref:Peptidase C14 caspase domain-containing protein n=1 Tax=Microlunatus parietis TaxID=682979 RepID=A0A7Y9LAE5_9ACTN|nr:caspase family protein [Microlunatus parietis]NYE70592.1 hypothetical protein [Microlunatus parietis]